MLKTDPLSIFQNSASPAARQALARWGGQKAFPADVRRLPPQDADGSWNGSVHDTILHLYQHWLVQPALDQSVQRGLRWLLECDRPPKQGRTINGGVSYDHLFFSMGPGDPARLRTLRGAPFGAGCSGFVKTGAALFLAQVFGFRDERVELAYQSLERIPALRRGWWCSSSCGANLFQAYAVHPQFSHSPAMDLALGYLADRQGEDGAWSGGIAFYETFNALSRVADSSAQRQFDRALPRVLRAQSADGAWGRSDRELKTLLVLDALERKGLPITV